MAQLVVAVAGAALGSLAGPGALLFGMTGAQLGWLGGSMLGSLFGPKQRSEGPRLSDLKVAAGSYGATIPWVEGHPRLGGIVVWCSEKREIKSKREVGGKGGGGTEVTEYSYEIDLLYMLSSNALVKGVRRIWNNGDLVWSFADTANNETLQASDATVRWDTMRFYSGAADQLPDPTYEAAVGVGNAPAYRDRCTVLLKGVKLGSGGQMPNLTFEVFTVGSSVVMMTTNNNAIGVTFSVTQWDPQGGVGVPVVLGASSTVRVGTVGGGPVYEFDLDGKLLGTSAAGPGDQYPGPWAWGTYQSRPVGMIGGVPVRFQGYNRRISEVVSLPLGAYNASTSGEEIPGPDLAGPLPGAEYVSSVALAKSAHAIILTAPTNPWLGGAVADKWYLVAYQGGVVSIVDQGTVSPVLATYALGLGNNGADGTGYPFRACAANTSLDQVWAVGYTGVELYEIDKQTKNLALKQSFSIAIGTNSPSIYVWETAAVVVARTRLAFFAIKAAQSTIPVADVVTRQCQRAGLTASQIDVSDLAGLQMHSMAVTQQSTPRQVLEVLGTAYQFESVSAGKLKFVKRGKPHVADIPYTDLGATDGDVIDEPLPIRRANDMEAPAQVVVRFANIDDSYQDGAESSDRLTSIGIGTDVRELPIGLTPTEAKRLADVMVMDMHAGLCTVGPISLPLNYAALEPTDPVLLTDLDGRKYRARITKMARESGTLSCEGVIEDSNVLTSAVVTSAGYDDASSIRQVPPCEVEALDIPILRDADNNLGLYVAGEGLTDAPWPGAALFRSPDGVAEYKEIARLYASTPIGTCSTVLPDWAGGNLFDMSSTVTVDIGLAGELVSSTRDGVLNGANMALVGSEIIQFITATLQSPGVYKLAGLLRGRRGTEWAQTGHAASERFVLLDAGRMARIRMQASDLGVMGFFKAASIGRKLSTGMSKTVTPQGVALKPFAPVNLRVNRDAPGVTLLTWDRRTRMSGEFIDGQDVPLGEAAERYAVELYAPGGALAMARETTAPSIQLDGLVVGRSYSEHMARVVGHSSGVVMSRTTLQNGAVRRFDPATGEFTGGEAFPRLGSSDTVGTGLVIIGTNVFASTIAGSDESRLYRYPIGAMNAHDGYYVAPLAADLMSICSDGAFIWAACNYSGLVVKIDPATLTVAASFALSATSICHDGTHLFLGGSNGTVRKVDPATGAVLQTITVVSGSTSIVGSVLVAAGTLYALVWTPGTSPEDGAYACSVATGDRIAALGRLTASSVGADTAYTPAFVAVGNTVAYVEVASPDKSIVFVDAATAAVKTRIAAPDVVALAGYANGLLFAAYSFRSPYSGYATRAYQPIPDLTGYTAKVYQLSDAVGRGYPGTRTL